MVSPLKVTVFIESQPLNEEDETSESGELMVRSSNLQYWKA